MLNEAALVSILRRPQFSGSIEQPKERVGETMGKSRARSHAAPAGANSRRTRCAPAKASQWKKPLTYIPTTRELNLLKRSEIVMKYKEPPVTEREKLLWKFAERREASEKRAEAAAGKNAASRVARIGRIERNETLYRYTPFCDPRNEGAYDEGRMENRTQADAHGRQHDWLPEAVSSPPRDHSSEPQSGEDQCDGSSVSELEMEDDLSMSSVDERQGRPVLGERCEQSNVVAESVLRQGYADKTSRTIRSGDVSVEKMPWCTDTIAPQGGRNMGENVGRMTAGGDTHGKRVLEKIFPVPLSGTLRS